MNFINALRIVQRSLLIDGGMYAEFSPIEEFTEKNKEDTIKHATWILEYWQEHNQKEHKKWLHELEMSEKDETDK